MEQNVFIIQWILQIQNKLKIQLKKYYIHCSHHQGGFHPEQGGFFEFPHLGFFTRVDY